MTDIKIDVQRTGFPVKISGVELWFDSSPEKLNNFYNLEQVAMEKFQELCKKAADVQIPDVEYVKENQLTSEESEEAFKSANTILDLEKGRVSIFYDELFGEGTFDKLYKKIPDYRALEDVLKPIMDVVSEKIIKQEEEREKEFDKIQNEYIKKQAKKANQK